MWKYRTFLAVIVPLAILASDPIYVPPALGVKPSHLMVFVPGGKVPPHDYVNYVNQTIHSSKVALAGAIVTCGQLNLCDPLGQLDSEVDKAITNAEKQLGVTFPENQIFVFGHSLGGVGARHYVDMKGASKFAGLALLGTQYNGDHEDFKGTLGYPENLEKFPIPFLGLLGEMDSLPISHAAKLFSLNLRLDAVARTQKPVIIVPGMDHSQFCSPFHVSGDLMPEISDIEATQTVSTITATWIDNVVALDSASQSKILNWMKTTEKITAAFNEAAGLEAEDWCKVAQMTALSNLPPHALAKVKIGNVLVRNSSTTLEHGHTNFSVDALGNINLTIVSYAYHPEVSSWDPVKVYAPAYAGALDISCKMVSVDRVAQQLKMPGTYAQIVTCADINRVAFKKGRDLLQTHWPTSIGRFEKQGRGIDFKNDSSVTIGPQWVFLSELLFSESNSLKNAEITSPVLYSSISSKIFPGNFYCKVVSPAKVVEWYQTRSLTDRY